MALRFQSVCIDAHDPSALATFWEGVLGWPRTFDDGIEVVLEPTPDSPGPDLLFLRVPEGKSVKHRLHIDLRPDDQAAEVARVEGLGGRRVDIGQGDDVTWVVLADPEGNEFCILRALRPDET
jgi:predicted enzyme related to lactoylglutathione lyase